MRRGIRFGFEIASILTATAVIGFSSPAWGSLYYEEFLDQMKKECEQEASLGPPSEGSGPSKDMVVECADAAAKGKLKGLIGRLRALKETKDLLLRDARILDCATNKCAAKYWGTLPSWANSAAGLVIAGQDPKRSSEWNGWINAGGDVFLDTVVEGSPAATTWAGAGGEALENEKISEFLLKDSITNATRRAADYLTATGDVAGANRIYLNNAGVIPNTGIRIPTGGQIRKGAKWAGRLIAVYDYVKASKDLVDSYYASHEARLEANQLAGEISKLDGLVDDVLEQIAALRERCKPCATGQQRDATGPCMDPCDANFKCPPGVFCGAGTCR